MIYAVCGTPGSFKSCYCVEKFVLPALKEGRKVFTNIEGLDPRYIATLFDLDPVHVESNLNVLGRVYDDDGTYHEDRDKIRRFYEDLPLNSLVVIDEAQIYFSSRDFKEGFSADLIPWLTKHRHLGIDVVWVTQSLESVDITFRRNTGLCYALRRTENMGLKNMSFIYIYDRADNITAVRHLARKMYRPDPRIFACYSSYQAEEVVEKRKSYNVFLRSPFVWLMIVSFIWLGYTFFSGAFSRKVLHSQPKKELPIEKPVERPQSVSLEDTKRMEVKNEVQNVDDKGCIVRVAKMRGQPVYVLADGRSVPDPVGRLFCP